MGSPFRILTPAQASPKLAKPGPDDWRPIVAAVLHLSPGRISGRETCGARTKGCTASCLNSAGRGGIGAQFSPRGELIRGNTIQAARIRRTRVFFEQSAEFMRAAVADLDLLERQARAVDGIPAARPNGTSDLDWTAVACMRKNGRLANIFEAFPGIRFWDYTKHEERLSWDIPNYALTFSRAETLANRLASMRVLQSGRNVAAVFGTKKGQPLPESWNGHRVIDGDVTDFRFTDPAGVVVGLRAKGSARRDRSGFVIPV
jgi:hypothetical protein